jgi:hypothetical protein
MNRRKLLSWLAAFLPAMAVAQKSAVLEKGQAVVCDDTPVKCPLRHDSCKEVNAPLVVGNGNKDYPDAAQLFDYRVFVCDVCGVLFTIKT